MKRLRCGYFYAIFITKKANIAKFKNAKAYFDNKLKTKVWKKASKGLNKGLYESYKILCNYAHVNRVAIDKNIMNGKISIGANNVLSNPAAIFTNSIYYYLINIICDYYEIEKSDLKAMNVPKEIIELNDSFNAEKIVVEVFANMVSDVGGDRDMMIREYNKYKEELKQKSLNASKNKKKKHRRKK